MPPGLFMTEEMSSLAVLLLPLLRMLVLVFLSCESSYTKATDITCPSRPCGRHNISHPFRLQDSQAHCGDPRYTLSCEGDRLLLYWKSGKFNVQSINYKNYTIRLVDANLDLHTHDRSSLPPYSFSSYNFSSVEDGVELLPPYSWSDPYQYWFYRPDKISDVKLVKQMLYLRCPHPVESSDLYVDDSTATCINGSYALGSTFYLNVFDKSLWDLGLGDSCRIEWMYLTSWPAENNHTNIISCTDIHNMLLYGFELSWAVSSCKNLYNDVVLDYHNNVTCYNSLSRIFHALLALFGRFIISIIISIFFIVPLVLLVLGRFVLGAFLVIICCIYKWRRRHLSLYAIIEDFLRSDNSIMPIRYSYKDIKNITGGFKTKLGNGGFGSVYQGKLRSGHLVAVKVLNKAKSNGQDFINEVATIGRIHHVNVVQLIGFCVEGSKRALIYELMENGSLEKYIFSHEDSASLSCEKLHTISLGVARGVEYLHNGCDMKILHFDIKPHNILLDENFNPKVSDFGLARLYSTDNSILSLTAARGTIGYMAPELFYRNVGSISYKADVYSFGMLLMEMAGRRKNVNALNEHSSQIYFPFWVYDQLHDGKEIAIENDTDEEMKLAKKMMIVALWCIQTKPSDRPSMGKVIEMLEQDEGLLQMPPRPYFYDAYDVPAGDVGDHSSSRQSSETSISDSK